MTTEQIAATLTALHQSMTATRPTVATSGCNTPGCQTCTGKAGKR